MELDIKKVFSVIQKKFPAIIAISLIFGFIAFTYTYFFITPLYTSSSTLYVQSNEKREDNRAISSSDHLVSVELVSTVAQLIKNRACIDLLAEQTGLGSVYSYENFRKMISVHNNGTESFRLSVSCEDPEHSFRIVNSLSNIISNASFVNGNIVNASDDDPNRGYVKKILQAGTVTLIDEAKHVPIQPSSPNVASNSLVGILIGAMLSVCFFVLIDQLNTKIMSEDDILSVCETIPILGSIPLITSEDKRGGYMRNA